MKSGVFNIACGLFKLKSLLETLEDNLSDNKIKKYRCS